MGVIKDGIKHICKRMDDIKSLLNVELYQLQNNQLRELDKIKKEIVAMNDMLNDFGEMLEDLTQGDADHTIQVQPVNSSKGETLFLVSGDELCNLLEACKGATVRMKKEAKKRDAE